MKKLTIPLFLFLILSLSSCELIGDIFKAGAITGIIAVVLVVALIFWVIAKIAG